MEIVLMFLVGVTLLLCLLNWSLTQLPQQIRLKLNFQLKKCTEGLQMIKPNSHTSFWLPFYSKYQCRNM